MKKSFNEKEKKRTTSSPEPSISSICTPLLKEPS